MKSIGLLLFQILLVLGVYSQNAVSRHWDARFGGTDDDILFDLIQTADGCFILGGASASGISGNKTQICRGGADYWILKTDANGNYLWDKTYGGTDADYLRCLCQTSDGGYLLAGGTLSDSGADKSQPSWGGWDYWVVKIDSLGNKQWDARFGGTEDESPNAVVQTNDGGYVIAGQSNSGISGNKTQPNRSNFGGTYDFWIVKIDSNGRYQWDKTYGTTGEDDCYDIIQTPDGGYLAGGVPGVADTSADKSQVNYGPNPNYWVIKMDSAGDKQWDRVYGGAMGEDLNICLNTKDGNYMLGGTSYDNVSGDKTATQCGYWLVKIDTSGNRIGDWGYGNGGCGTLYSLSPTPDNGYIMTGMANGIMTIKTDSLMNQVWQKVSVLSPIGCAYQPVSAIESENGCYVVGVQTTAGIGGDKTQPNWDPGDSTFDYWMVEYCDSFPLGIQQPVGAMHLLVYPNPTAGDLSISIQKDGLTEASFTLTDPTGQAIYQNTADHQAHSYTKILDLSKLPAGIYMLDVTVDGERIVKKVVKE